MTGRSRSGKMSTRIRLTANTAVSAIAITPTMIVIGRRSAARINHMARFSLGLANEVQERREVSVRDGNRKARAPDVDTRELVLHFRLGEQALGIRHFDHAGQAG